MLSRPSCRRVVTSFYYNSSRSYAIRGPRKAPPPTAKNPLLVTPYLNLKSLQNMSEAPKVGEVRARSEERMDTPAMKKQRVEIEVEAVPTTQKSNIVVVKAEDMETRKRNDNGKAKGKGKRKQKKITAPEPCSSEDVLFKDIVAVLGQAEVDKVLEEGTELDSPFEFHQEVELEVRAIGSNGEGIAVAPGGTKPWAVVVPLTLPGERIRARIYKNARLHSFADLLEITTPNPELRDDSRVKCKYFGACGGCQYQILSYETQLDLKRDVVVKAYKNYSNLPQSSLPPILSTIASPLEYGYRTKLTPHFEAPPAAARKNPSATSDSKKPDRLAIGFNKIGTHKTMDIEECPIATPVINAALGPARERIIKNIHTYKRGVSLIFRDSLDTTPDIDPRTAQQPIDKLSEAFTKQICVTDHKATVRETVGEWIFEYNGGSFFQNNNSVLVPLTDYVRDAIFPPPSVTDPSSSSSSSVTVAVSVVPDTPRPTHLVDTYCGSGLFAITLSPNFEKVAGIELSTESITFATRNARLNGISPDKISFRSGDASDIFSVVGDFPPSHSVVVIDPPRKGCDDAFIALLLKFRPAMVVYVSCNVHTQARDVGKILNATADAGEGERYVLQSLRGFDLFPQTAHVESVAVLRLV